MSAVRGFEVWDGVNVTSEAQRVLLQAYALIPVSGLYATSATRSDPGSFHDWASQLAIDVGGGGATTAGAERMRAFVNAVWPIRSAFAEFIFRDLRTGRAFGIKWGNEFSFGDSILSQHENHVHTAATLDGARRILRYLEAKYPPKPPAPPAPPPVRVKPSTLAAVLR